MLHHLPVVTLPPPPCVWSRRWTDGIADRRRYGSLPVSLVMVLPSRAQGAALVGRVQ